MGTGLKKIMEIIDDAVFPSNIYCMCCGSLIDRSRPYSLCDECIRKFHWITGRTCSKCGKALPDTFQGELCYDCMIREHNFTKGYSCLTYGLHEREVLMDYKYGGKGYLGKKFGDILYDRISLENLDIDVIIPVPISASRLHKRGYNQAEIMAERLAKLMGVSCDCKSLMRVKDTPRLRSLSPSEREVVLAEAFALRKTGKQKIQDRKILLIDDIYTTGATADACSKTLIEAGAEQVIFLSLTSGGNRKPDIDRNDMILKIE